MGPNFRFLKMSKVNSDLTLEFLADLDWKFLFWKFWPIFEYDFFEIIDFFHMLSVGKVIKVWKISIWPVNLLSNPTPLKYQLTPISESQTFSTFKILIRSYDYMEMRPSLGVLFQVNQPISKSKTDWKYRQVSNHFELFRIVSNQLESFWISWNHFNFSRTF